MDRVELLFRRVFTSNWVIELGHRHLQANDHALLVYGTNTPRINKRVVQCHRDVHAEFAILQPRLHQASEVLGVHKVANWAWGQVNFSDTLSPRVPGREHPYLAVEALARQTVCSHVLEHASGHAGATEPGNELGRQPRRRRGCILRKILGFDCWREELDLQVCPGPALSIIDPHFTSRA